MGVHRDAITSIYLHVPFCAKRCFYCDFHTAALDREDPLLDDYVFALSNYVRRASRADLLGEIETIYIGGGTPTYLGLKRLSSLIYMISLRINLKEDTEFTLEANPDSFTEQLLKDTWALGVNRYSLGVQSFDDEVLGVLGRIHDAAAAEKAIGLLKARGANFSIDLMCGIPGQSMQSWEDTLRKAVELEAPHVSIYPLSVEENTVFGKSLKEGLFIEKDPDVVADEMLLAEKILEEAGLGHYEIASYARPGFESRHNIAYWTGRSYLGLGSHAASCVTVGTYEALQEAGIISAEGVAASSDATTPSRIRFLCGDDAREFSQEPSMHVDAERLSAREAACEDIMLRMRMMKGITSLELDVFSDFVPGARECFESLIEDGLVEKRGESYVASTGGWLLANEIFGRIWGLSTK